MDKNLQDMEKMFEEINLDFLDEDMSENDSEEIKEAMKQLLEEIDNEESDS
jgi:hypothetical protein